MGSIWYADFHSTLIRTSFIQLSCLFVLDAKAGRYSGSPLLRNWILPFRLAVS